MKCNASKRDQRHGRSRHRPTKVFEIVKLILRPWRSQQSSWEGEDSRNLRGEVVQKWTLSTESWEAWRRGQKRSGSHEPRKQGWRDLSDLVMRRKEHETKKNKVHTTQHTQDDLETAKDFDRQRRRNATCAWSRGGLWTREVRSATFWGMWLTFTPALWCLKRHKKLEKRQCCRWDRMETDQSWNWVQGDRGSMEKPEGSSQTQAGKGALGFGGLCHFLLLSIYLPNSMPSKKITVAGLFEFIKTGTFAIWCGTDFLFELILTVMERNSLCGNLSTFTDFFCFLRYSHWRAILFSLRNIHFFLRLCSLTIHDTLLIARWAFFFLRWSRMLLTHGFQRSASQNKRGPTTGSNHESLSRIATDHTTTHNTTLHYTTHHNTPHHTTPHHTQHNTLQQPQPQPQTKFFLRDTSNSPFNERAKARAFWLFISGQVRLFACRERGRADWTSEHCQRVKKRELCRERRELWREKGERALKRERRAREKTNRELWKRRERERAKSRERDRNEKR